MESLEFSASDEELQLSTRLLETNNWHGTNTLSVDAALTIFKQSGLTFKQIRDIWSIADRKGSGTLTKLELAVVVRLMGWVQAGAPLHESLLASGPMPFIKGITEALIGSSSKPANNSLIPPINPMDVERFGVAFKSASPVQGILSREKATVTLLENGLSYNYVRKIIDLVDASHKIDFAKFALAFHLGDLLHSSKITSLPSVIPQYLQDQVAFFNISDPPPPPSDQPWMTGNAALSSRLMLKELPELPHESDDKGGLSSALQELESDLLLIRSQIEEYGSIPGPTILKFMTDHKVESTELARIWYVATELEQIRGSSTHKKNKRLTGVFLDLFLERLKEVVGQDASKSSSHASVKILSSSPVQVDDTVSTDSFSSSPSHSPAFPVMKIDPLASLTSSHISDSTSPSNISDILSLSSPLSPTSPALFANESFGNDGNKKITTKIKMEAANLLLRVKRNLLRRSHQRNQLHINHTPFDEKSLKMAPLPSVIPEYFQGQVACSKMPILPPLPSLQPWISGSPASPLTLMPKELPAKSPDSGDLPPASQKVESDLLLVKSQIDVDGAISGETILKFMTDYNVKPAELAEILWGPSPSNINDRPTGVSLDLFLEHLKEKAVRQEVPRSSFSHDPCSNSPSHGPLSTPFPVTKPDSFPSPTSCHISDISNQSSPLSRTSPATFPNESFGTNTLKKTKTNLKTEAANLLLRVKTNVLRHSDQWNQLQLTNRTPRDVENLAPHFEVQGLATKLSSEHITLHHQHKHVRASRAKAQDETKNLRQAMTTQREEISKLPTRLTAKPIPSSVADSSLLQKGHVQLSPEVKEMREMNKHFISSAQSCNMELNHPIATYEDSDNTGVWALAENIHVGRGSLPDLPTSRGFNNEWNGSSRHLSTSGGGSVECDTHSTSEERAPAFDDVSGTFGELSRTSQATTIRVDPFPYEYEYTHKRDPPTPAHSQHMEYLRDTGLWNVRREGANPQPQVQITGQSNAPAGRSQDPEEVPKIDVRHQAELRLLTRKLPRERKVECEGSKKTQNSIFVLQVNLSDAKKHAEQLQDVINRQHEVILSLERNCFCWDIVGPPSYEEKPVCSTSSGW